MTKILVVEDEDSVLDPLELLLNKEGFTVITAKTGKEALEKFDNTGADLILLDLMIPEVSGTEVCRQIRSKSQVPIIMLTAKDTEVDKVVGLELGADDYVVKPYSKAELIARIKAVLRRGASTGIAAAVGPLLTAGPVEIDVESHKVKVNGDFVTFPLKEFELLEFLVRNSGRVLTRTQLIDRIWGSDYFGDTKTLDVHIKRIRAKIEKDPANPVLILTIRGLGYKFEN
jgi:two-component system response regulator RegX3